MGTLYYDNTKYAVKRWRVQIRHRGFKTISRSFDNKKEAEVFLQKAQNIIKKKTKFRKDKKAFDKLKEKI